MASIARSNLNYPQMSATVVRDDEKSEEEDEFYSCESSNEDSSDAIIESAAMHVRSMEPIVHTFDDPSIMLSSGQRQRRKHCSGCGSVTHNILRCSTKKLPYLLPSVAFFSKIFISLPTLPEELSKVLETGRGRYDYPSEMRTLIFDKCSPMNHKRLKIQSTSQTASSPSASALSERIVSSATHSDSSVHRQHALPVFGFRWQNNECARYSLLVSAFYKIFQFQGHCREEYLSAMGGPYRELFEILLANQNFRNPEAWLNFQNASYALFWTQQFRDVMSVQTNSTDVVPLAPNCPHITITAAYKQVKEVYKFVVFNL